MPGPQDLVNADRSLLLVDDDKPFLSRLERAMERRGFDVRSADSVAAGLAARNAAHNKNGLACQRANAD